MTLPAHITKSAVIEALVCSPSLAAAGRAIGLQYSSHERQRLLERFGVEAYRVRDVVIVRDSQARIEGCEDRQPGRRRA